MEAGARLGFGEQACRVTRSARRRTRSERGRAHRWDVRRRPLPDASSRLTRVVEPHSRLTGDRLDAYLEAMVGGASPFRRVRWVLVALLVAGHVCVVAPPVGLAAPGSSSEGGAHAHEGEAAASCEPPDALSNATTAKMTEEFQDVLEAAEEVPFRSESLRAATSPSLKNRGWPSARPPLFVLYASLLI